MKARLLLAAAGLFITVSTPALADIACSGERLTILNFYDRYKTIRDQIQNVDELARPTDNELCAWNRFFFLDSVLYFQLDRDLVSDKGLLSSKSLHMRLLNLRNQLLTQWLDKITLGKSTDFSEWAGKDVKGKSIQQFLEMGSQQFSLVETASDLANPAPLWGESENEEADAYVYRLLQARTPFSSIMPELALKEAARPEVASAVSCLYQKAERFECGQNLYSLALSCSMDQDPGIALETLGLFSSQRFYLLRDLKTWIEQNMDGARANQVFETFRMGAKVYFLIETIGNRCGPEGLFPMGTDTSRATIKNYHFWAEALLAGKLAEMGFNPIPAVQAALGPGRLYKAVISKVGIVYDWLLGVSSQAGTSGDVDEILREQKLGAEFGYGIGSTVLPHGLYSIFANLSFDQSLIREITNWTRTPTGIDVDILEIDPTTAGEEDPRIIRYKLSFQAHPEYLLMKRVTQPRVKLTERGLSILF